MMETVRSLKKSSFVLSCASNQNPHLELTRVWLKKPVHNCSALTVCFVWAMLPDEMDMVNIAIRIFFMSLVHQSVYSDRHIIQSANGWAGCILYKPVIKYIGAADLNS